MNGRTFSPILASEEKATTTRSILDDRVRLLKRHGNRKQSQTHLPKNRFPTPIKRGMQKNETVYLTHDLRRLAHFPSPGVNPPICPEDLLPKLGQKVRHVHLEVQALDFLVAHF